MARKLRMMAVLAHPDDESLGLGGTLARYAREGVETFVVTATRGERGRNGTSRDSSPEELGALREAELRAACSVLGVSEVRLLGYPDGGLAQVDAGEATARIASEIRRVKPDVVVTFGPEGAYGHPDHIAISQLATAAAVRAAARSQPVSKLYYMAWTKEKWDAYQAALKKLVSKVDGVEREATPWAEWAITTVVDTERYWPEVWRAVSCHETQMSIYRNLAQLPEEHHRGLWGSQEFYRAFSLVNGGRTRETDLFEGVHEG
ncbi:MAG: PIG-L family deacetylase [Bryobacterales bacterium]|nr:PIG-L family deacetylase [Bryobacterales bacterium]